MNWEDDINLLNSKKPTTKQGRRSSNKLSSEGSEEILVNETTESFIDSAPMKTRKIGVWGDEAPKSSKVRSGTNLIEIERFRSDKIQDSDDDDIPVIPDIEDLQDDSINIPDVKPVITVNKSTYKELDSQLDNLQNDKINFGTMEDIDLSFLTNKLYPEKEVQSSSEVWTLESLYNDLSRSFKGS